MPLEFNFCILRCFINLNSKIQSKQFIRELNLSLQSRNTQVANEILSEIGILSLMICSMICRRFSRRLKFCWKNHIESEAIFFFFLLLNTKRWEFSNIRITFGIGGLFLKHKTQHALVRALAKGRFLFLNTELIYLER